MALFQNSVLDKYLKAQDKQAIQQAYKNFKAYFFDPAIQENIKNLKEEEYQGIFLTELFVKILGYTLKPNANFNLVAEYKNQTNARKADGAILSNETAIGVIELKGTNTKDLERIRQQAFDYKANQKGCVYVITSNYEKLRFYINDATEFLEFDLFKLTEDQFSLLYLSLHKDNILNNLPLKIKEASISEEEAITKNFYSDYSNFKRELFRDLVKNNLDKLMAKADEKQEPEELEKTLKRTLFKKSQKLIDRFLFIFFAEDRGLLPPNFIYKIIEDWNKLKDLEVEKPLYERFKLYFNHLDSGRKGTDKKAEIYAYNGGLFKPDDTLDNLIIGSELLNRYTGKLSSYDFESQVGVNILGHIFENSLNEIESVNAEIEGGDFDEQKSKRKKDGVYYTPKYITKYIVENTLGKLCQEEKNRLGFREEDYFEVKKGTHKETKKKLLKILDDYRDWLLELTICDPACGSGAFLNQTLNFLIEEHQYLDELKAKVLGGGIVFSDIEKTILENNIYGVDINEESVEIAKLSLWLRTAQPRRKLNDLSNNIKCGNSLIDDKEVAGDKAFSWEREFSNIFKEKNKKAYHITTAIHDSRTSERMEKYEVRKRRDFGTNPYPNIVYFTPEDDFVITKTLKEIVEEDELNILAFNICGDHIHVLIVCELEKIPRIMQKIKAVTSKNTRQHPPLHSDTRQHAALQKKKNKPLWQQKYSAPKEITSSQQLTNTLNYIEGNRRKHDLKAHPKETQDLIDELTCTFDQAFEPEFTGGFDVVIGNPPYVRPRNLTFFQKDFLIEEFECAENQFDLYHLFIEKAEHIKNKQGIVSFILPNAFLANQNSKKLRKYILDNCTVDTIVECGTKVFKEASVEVLIYIFHEKSKKPQFGRLMDKQVVLLNNFNPDLFYKNYNYNFTVTLSQSGLKIHQFIKEESVPLGSLSKVMGGIKEYQVGKGKPKQTKKDKQQSRFNSNIKRDDTFVKEVRGKHIYPYFLNWNNEYLSYGPWIAEPRKPEYFEGPRIFIRQIPGTNKLYSCFTDEDFIVDQSAYIIKNKPSSGFKIESVLPILNSKLIFWFYRNESNEFDKLFPKIKSKEIKNLPIPKGISKKSDFLQRYSRDVNIMNQSLFKILEKFSAYLKQNFSFQKLPRKLQNWQELNFGQFIKELKKAINKENRARRKNEEPELPKLTKKDEFEWMELFEDNKEKAVELQNKINQTEAEIDQMVYELYGLNEEEIEIIENS